MNRKLITIAAACLITFFTVSMAFALGGGNGRKGKFLYRKNCYKTCHEEKVGGLSPANKTQAEWTAIFSDTSKIPCHDKWPAVPEKDLNDIFTYLHDYAKDSPSPAKCS
ncbi:MAG: cytochrome c [Pseudodesulfovibrio sp.]|nr:cytochrome c [Pseudodesulfovibrio sp.]